MTVTINKMMMIMLTMKMVKIMILIMPFISYVYDIP